MTYTTPGIFKATISKKEVYLNAFNSIAES